MTFLAPPSKVSAMGRSRLLLLLLRRRHCNHRSFSLLPSLNTLTPSSSLPRRFSTAASSGPSSRLHLLFQNPPSFFSFAATEDVDSVLSEVSALADDLLAASDHSDLAPILESRGAAALLRRSPDGSASLHLLNLLKPRPLLALQVFIWRRKLADSEIPLLPEEYAKAITLAGRARDVDLAADLFAESNAAFAEPCLYNALMSAYMYNGLTKKCVAVFDDLRCDPRCDPTIVTYNILISLFGRSLLINHMEAVLRTIDEAGIPRTLETYNTVIAAYVTAWTWDRMEQTFKVMEDGPVKPEMSTHLLMLRGYALSGNLEKMEKAYELVREHVNDREVPLIRAMICAYCKSKDPDRVQKIERLMEYISYDAYRPWLNVLLIKVYAQEGLVEKMEQLISEALQRSTTVTTVGIMRSIISSYFRCAAVDRLAGFIRQAEYAGWRLCRSLYHCKMVMYGQQNRLAEMHGVLDEMENYRFNRTKKTFLIMHKAYSNVGRRTEAETIVGMMWKHGFASDEDCDCFIS